MRHLPLLLAFALASASSLAAIPAVPPPRVTNPEPARPIPPGPFEPTWDSLRAHYVVPDWFQDAKFGIFLHWGVYAVAARQSEWYPRHMYSNAGIAEWHRAQFGPPDRFGYKDLIPLFKAEHFDPVAWAALFKQSGARYVVPVAEHHDGFAMWDSALTRWNAKATGPHRDIIGELAAATRAQGLKFGVSYHRIENWSFMYPALDQPNDLFDPAYADFYGPPQPPPKGEQGAGEVMDGVVTPQSPAFLEEWLRRGQELVDRYQPDMVYFDNGMNGRGLDPIKLRFAAYYYNRAAEWGKAVSLATKGSRGPSGPAYLAGSVLDFERGHPSDILPGAWQTDNSVHARWGYLEDTTYRSLGTIIRELVDNVSKGGNLLLNFSPRADGTFPEEQVAILQGTGRWLGLNGEAIYGTRPWTRFGEGPMRIGRPAGADEQARIHREAVGDGAPPSYTGHDFRFTTKPGILYAIVMRWPAGPEALITSLATGPGVAARVEHVDLLGHGPIEFTQDAAGLHLKLPATAPCEHACTFKITGANLP